MNFARITAAAAAASLLGCAPRVVVVRSEGWAADDGANPTGASRRATFDALRRAVESASGVRIAARTHVRDGAAVSTRMNAEAQGCVLGYSVLSDRADAGGRKVRVKARVARAAAECGGPPAQLGANVEVVYEGQGPGGREAGRAAAELLSGDLVRRGWTVVGGRAPLTVVIAATATEESDARIAPLSGSHVELDVRVETGARRIIGRTASRAVAAEDDPLSAARTAARTAAAKVAGPSAEFLAGGFWAAAEDD